MAVHHLLLRGMLVGVIAGLLAFGFARILGESAVDRAIAFESAETKAKGEAPEPEIVSREVQKNAGLPLGAMIYGGALGGIFALLFALAHGRFSQLAPRGSAAVLAFLCFIVVFVVPFLKYPANPPAIGEPATIGLRTGLYVSMIFVSVVAIMVAFSLERWVEARVGAWNATLAGALMFIALVSVAAAVMPQIDEVPTTFPAATLWQFRIVAFGIQAVLWGVIGLLFGALTERSIRT